MQQQATEYLAQGQYDEAIHLYEQCIEANPGEMSNYWYLGLAWLLQGQELEAQSVWLLPIMQATPENVDACIAQLVEVLEAEALRHLQADNLQQAESIYRQILELNSDCVQAYYNLGTMLVIQEKLDEAIACLQKAVEIKPNFTEAYQNLGYGFQKQGNFSDAIFCYLKVLEFNPDWSETHYQLGICFAEQDKLDEAIACFQKATEIQPNYTQAYCSCGDALLQQGKLEEAIACFKKTIQLNPKFAQAYHKWRDNLAKQGQLDDEINSRNDFLKGLLLQQDSPSVYFLIGNRLATNNNLYGAINCYKKSLTIKPTFIEAKYQLETVLQRKDNQDEANACFPETLLVNPPKGVYESTSDWVFKSGLDKRNYIKVASKELNSLTQPRTPDRSVTFPPKETQSESPESFVVTIPNGRVWFGKNKHSDFSIITSDNFLLADLSSVTRLRETNKHPIFSVVNLPPIYNLDETVVVVPGKFGYNYFHWMIDIFPSLGFLHRSGIDINGIEKIFIDSYCDLQFQKESLEALGIPKTKIIDIDQYSNNYPHLKANCLVVPSPNQTVRATKWSCEFLRNLFLNKNNLEKSNQKERLYISRKMATRQVINEDEVIVFLEKFGFKSVTLESLSVYDQASLLATAEVVISAHGAGLTNLIFCSPGTKVIEIFSAYSLWPYYWVISNQVGLEYYYLIGEGLECDYLHRIMYPSPYQADVLVNLDSLLNIMKFAGLA
jgi:tetratricopeptide (TPR) repeat protein